MINRYPNHNHWEHKNNFSELTKIARELDPEGFDCIPPTFVLPGPDSVKFDAYKKAHPNATFIAKPNEGSGGDAITLFTKLSDLPNRLKSAEMTVQRYIANPLLVNGFKFDLRVYIILAGFDPIHAYVAKEGLARFCTVSSSHSLTRFHSS